MYCCNRVQPRGGPQIGIRNGVQKGLEIIGSTAQGHTCPECWQLWPVVGGAGKGAAEENWCWDLNPGMAAIWRLFLGPRILLGLHGFGIFKGTTWLGQEPGPCGFGIAPYLPHGWCWEPESRTSTFLRYRTLDWAKGRRKDCVRL